MTDRPAADIVLRPATMADTDDIARILRAARLSFDWMPDIHTPEEDRGFVRGHLLPHQAVTVAQAGGRVVGFISIENDWVEQLYLDPAWTGRGIGSVLLKQATEGMATVNLFCFQANKGARRLYERHGFLAEVFSDGATNDEKLPDIHYIRRV
jgi:GNAT superfamily N-acetyltransferase